LGHWKNSSFFVLGSARFQANLAGMKINLPPLQSQDLAFGPPSRQIRKLDHRLDVFWKQLQKSLELIQFEEPFANVIFGQHWYVWLADDFACFNCERKTAL
jgi:hypothetical protein